MNAILDILLRGMDIIERLRTSSALTDIQMIIFGVLLVFGVINCILGYRLLRFWMMLFGFAIGAGLGYGASFLMGIWDTTMQLAVSAGVGVVLAIIVFISYKAGIFVMGAGLGLGIAVYVLHPTTSLMFFVCLLAGVGIGSLAIKWAREVIITGTSLLGGAMAGMALAKLGGLAEFPYGIGLSAAFAALGMLIQFATNKKKYIDEYEEEEEYVKPVKNKVKKSVEKEYADDFIYREPLRKTEPRPRGNSSRRERPVDIQVGGEHTRRGEYYGLDSDKTIIYRPRKKSEPEFDLPLDSMHMMTLMEEGPIQKIHLRRKHIRSGWKIRIFQAGKNGEEAGTIILQTVIEKTLFMQICMMKISAIMRSFMMMRIYMTSWILLTKMNWMKRL